MVGTHTPQGNKLGTGSFQFPDARAAEREVATLSGVGPGQSVAGRVSQVPVKDDRLAGRFRIGPGVTDGTFLSLLIWKARTRVPFDLWPQLYHRGAQTIAA